MLILTRKKGQRIVIEYGSGETAVIEVQKAKPSSIRIGVDAPQQLEIHRAERKSRVSGFFAKLFNRLRIDQ